MKHYNMKHYLREERVEFCFDFLIVSLSSYIILPLGLHFHGYSGSVDFCIFSPVVSRGPVVESQLLLAYTGSGVAHIF